jgi:hemerythrin superfamily protein
MAAATQSTSKKSGSSKSRSAGLTSTGRPSTSVKDAVSDLMRDHRTVEKLFKDYEKAKEDGGRKQQIFQQIAMELKIHTTLEEELVYPASREWVKDEETVNEAEVEHMSAKDLIAQLEKSSPSDQHYDARVMVLKEMIEHHVQEEESEFFPELRKSDMDLKGLAESMRMRKEELMGKMGKMGKMDGGSRGLN